MNFFVFLLLSSCLSMASVFAEESSLEIGVESEAIVVEEVSLQDLLNSEGSLMNERISDARIVDTDVRGKVCYHTMFTNVDLSGVKWHFSSVTRHCNFIDSNAGGATFSGWLYHQRFENTSLRGATFDLDPRSIVTFVNCDLSGARIFQNGAQFNFIDTNLP